VLRGGPWTAAEHCRILDYCESDVDCLGPLLERMLPAIRARRSGLGQALLRGRYTAAVARIEQPACRSTSIYSSEFDLIGARSNSISCEGDASRLRDDGGR
jgi:hypothetical protein